MNVFCATANGFMRHCIAWRHTAKQSAGAPLKWRGTASLPVDISLAKRSMRSIASPCKMRAAVSVLAGSSTVASAVCSVEVEAVMSNEPTQQPHRARDDCIDEAEGAALVKGAFDVVGGLVLAIALVHAALALSIASASMYASAQRCSGVDWPGSKLSRAIIPCIAFAAK
jgi:hypothetical protein